MPVAAPVCSLTLVYIEVYSDTTRDFPPYSISFPWIIYFSEEFLVVYAYRIIP
jgi:hypothetical protein